MAQGEAEKAQRIHSGYDTLFGFILGTGNPAWEKSIMLRHLEALYLAAQLTLPDETGDKSESDSAGPADNTNGSSTPVSASTAS